jgi:enoyl-CoA hydratase/carnithine racemase
VQLGAFDEAVEPDAVVDRAVEVARELAELPAAVYARTKAQLRADTLATLRAAVAVDPLLQSWV